MRLCTFTLQGEGPGERRVGVVRGSKVFELRKRTTMLEILEGGTKGLETEDTGYELDRVFLSAPVPRPGKIVAAIVNTQGMLGGKDIHLERPRLDMKAPSIVVGPGAEILVPQGGIRPEVELAAVVGKRTSRASEREAAASIFGYTVLNDVTAPSDSRNDAYEAYRRDKTTGTIKKTFVRGPLFRSKNHDTFCPMGPWLVSADEVADASSLRMTTRFDGALVQEGSTSEYLFTPAAIFSYVSSFIALEPGDVISCGSVGWKNAAAESPDPTEFVLPRKEGTLELEIERIGRLTNPVRVENYP